MRSQQQQGGRVLNYAYQPIVNIKTRSIYAHEALVRGPNGEPAASVLAQVNDSNRYRFDQACRVRAVKGASRLDMREYGFPIDRIIFEVTEGEQVQDRGHLVNIFREYQRFGFRTAIDDFGAGYAGLNLLAEYQPHIVKIDMDLVRGIDTSPARQAIVRGIVGICGELSITVLAEGIETRAERDFLAGLGIELMQGYWFSKPVFRGLGVIPDSAWE